MTYLYLDIAIWLVFCALLDGRNRKLSPWLTVPTLAAGIMLAVAENRSVEAVFAILVVVAPDLAERMPRSLAISLGASVLVGVIVWSVLAAPMSVPVLLAMAYLLEAWRKNAMGGADILVHLTILLIAGFEAFLVIVVVTGVYALLTYAIHKHKTFPAMIPVLLGTAIWLAFIL